MIHKMIRGLAAIVVAFVLLGYGFMHFPDDRVVFFWIVWGMGMFAAIVAELHKIAGDEAISQARGVLDHIERQRYRTPYIHGDPRGEL